MDEQQFLQEKIRQYYSKNSVAVPEINTREFGVGEFGKKITRRHLAFSDSRELNAFLYSFAPFYISYSVAMYRFPAKTPMSAKGMEGADLVYEFDADDIKTPCKKKHDSWQCLQCKAEGKGSIEACTSCGAKVKVEQWFCSECLEETKSQLFSLLGFLEKDFGITEGISVNFSGNAGYHLHIRNGSVRELSHDARIEMIDYLTASNLLPESHGFFLVGKKMHCPSPLTAVGWGKRLVSGVLEMVEKEDAVELAGHGHVSLKKVQDFLKKKNEIISLANDSGILASFPGKKGEQFWQSVISHIAQKNALRLDRQTSMDISKILRVPDTIHGSTGLLAASIQLQELKSFSPLDSAVAFSADETVKVFINKSPKFYLAGQWLGPFENEAAELSLPAAIYLLARNSAVLENRVNGQ